MKKLPLILAVVSIIAVGFLFVREFTVPGNQVESGEAVEGSLEVSEAKIAYIELDTVILSFDMYFDLRDELMDKQSSSEARLNSKGKEYESGAMDFQEKVSKGLVTRATAAEMEQNLRQQQQDLMNLRNQLETELMEEERVMNNRILQYIYDYLDEFAAENDYDYVLGKSFGSPVMFANKNLDVTQAVLKGINYKYNEEQKKK